MGSIPSTPLPPSFPPSFPPVGRGRGQNHGKLSEIYLQHNSPYTDKDETSVIDNVINKLVDEKNEEKTMNFIEIMSKTAESLTQKYIVFYVLNTRNVEVSCRNNDDCVINSLFKTCNYPSYTFGKKFAVAVPYDKYLLFAIYFKRLDSSHQNVVYSYFRRKHYVGKKLVDSYTSTIKNL
jgi:hypothetical protein